ncbi:hypothetical protein [Streptomyces apocyni]|uniref:hypothetical protein n=1 Tax=Streptomyces apocyni TaxID=2654677 RepID=UPI001E60664E|nr:hypothetical protein [Streptomyces apocyni]
MWYAQSSSRRTRQMMVDGAVLSWAALWAVVAVTAYRLAQLLGQPAPGGTEGGTEGSRFSAELAEAGVTAARVPLVGGTLDAALRAVGGAGDRLVSAGGGGPHLVDVLAATGALALLVLPVGLVLTVWLPRRLRWSRQAVAARELATSDDGRELLALRALMRPLDEVARTATALPDATPGSLAEGWREGDPDTLDVLAEAELRRLGLRPAWPSPAPPLPVPVTGSKPPEPKPPEPRSPDRLAVSPSGD